MLFNTLAKAFLVIPLYDEVAFDIHLEAIPFSLFLSLCETNFIDPKDFCVCVKLKN